MFERYGVRRDPAGMDVKHWVGLVIGAMVLLIVVAALFTPLQNALASYAGNETVFGPILDMSATEYVDESDHCTHPHRRGHLARVRCGVPRRIGLLRLTERSVEVHGGSHVAPRTLYPTTG